MEKKQEAPRGKNGKGNDFIFLILCHWPQVLKKKRDSDAALAKTAF